MRRIMPRALIVAGLLLIVALALGYWWGGSDSSEEPTPQETGAVIRLQIQRPVERPRPVGKPRMWIRCPECAETGKRVPLLDEPGGQQILEMTDATWVYLLGDEQVGPDGRTYYRVWVTRREGWVDASFVSEYPSFVLEPTVAATPRAGEPLIFLPEQTHDFGDIPPDAPVEHVFTIENRGLGDLVIQNVKSSCGCASTVLGRNPIPPGEEGEIKATFDPTGYAGKRVTKTFKIISNDPANPELTVVLTVNVLEK